MCVYIGEHGLVRTVGGQYASMACTTPEALTSALSAPLGIDPWPARPLQMTSQVAMPFSPLLCRKLL